MSDDHMLSLDSLGRISDTALTREVEIRIGEEGLPTTFVPGRNLMFFMLAAAVADLELELAWFPEGDPALKGARAVEKT